MLHLFCKPYYNTYYKVEIISDHKFIVIHLMARSFLGNYSFKFCLNLGGWGVIAFLGGEWEFVLFVDLLDSVQKDFKWWNLNNYNIFPNLNPFIKGQPIDS